MESTRPIRALIRGLDALTVLNQRNGVTVSEVAHEINLPRTTTYRILETLSHAGYVYRDETDDRYRLTIMVRGLSDGFDDETWVTQIARPQIEDLGRQTVWPVTVATIAGGAVTVRETTDHVSPLAVERYSAGSRLPVLTTSSGRVYLAFCLPAQREAILEALARSTREEDKLAKDRVEVQRLLDEVCTQGYAVASRRRRTTDELSIAVPIIVEERVLAALSIRFSGAAVPLKLALERFLPKLRDSAQAIRRKFTELQRDPPPRHHRAALARSLGHGE